MRDHSPIVIEDFNGFFKRGADDSCPPDHSPDIQNVQFTHSGIKTRDGLDTYAAYRRPLRIYTYVREEAESLLILDDAGNIYHSTSPTPFGPILTIAGMTDFGFVAINGRAYITPCNSVTGLDGEFVYVYLGDGTPARKAGGAGPLTAMAAANSGTAGDVEAGYHVFAVVYETDTGFLTQISPGVALNCTGGFKVDLSAIPISPDAFVTGRRIVATKAIDPTEWTGDLTGYEFFFVPDGDIDDNSSSTLSVSFFDVELLTDASHLLDLFTEIPAGVGLTTYHGRLIAYTTFDDISLAYVSYSGEPEAVDTVSGLIIAPLDGNPLTNAQEFRDILYLFKSTRTFAYADNGDTPSAWPLVIVDQGIGSSVHGIGTVLDSGGVNVDYLIVVDYSGIMLFNGSYIRPELSWKIKDFWFDLDRDNFLNIQIMNDSITQVLFITLPNLQMMIGDYSNGLDAKNIRWAKWLFNVETTTITLVEKNKLIIGSHAEYVIE